MIIIINYFINKINQGLNVCVFVLFCVSWEESFYFCSQDISECIFSCISLRHVQ